MITQAQLKELLDYDPETGVFRWKVAKGTKRKLSIAGTPTTSGHIHIAIDRKKYFAHRLVFLYMYGSLPTDCTDHINGIGSDNRLANLRLATRAENSRNCRKPKNNKSGVKGVYWNKKDRKWRAAFKINNREFHIGSFDSLIDAENAIKISRDEAHGEFSNHG